MYQAEQRTESVLQSIKRGAKYLDPRYYAAEETARGFIHHYSSRNPEERWGAIRMLTMWRAEKGERIYQMGLDELEKFGLDAKAIDVKVIADWKELDAMIKTLLKNLDRDDPNKKA